MEKDNTLYNSGDLKRDYLSITGEHYEEDPMKYYQWVEEKLVERVVSEQIHERNMEEAQLAMADLVEETEVNYYFPKEGNKCECSNCDCV